MRTDEEIKELCDRIRENSFALHFDLWHGHLEKVYENGLVHRLRQVGFKVEQQKPLQVTDEDGTVLGGFFADLVVEDCLIVELKACKALAPEHTAYDGENDGHKKHKRHKTLCESCAFCGY